MAKRKTQIDKAIEVIDVDITIVENQLAVLRAARQRLVSQQQEPATAKTKTPSGHPEGGQGI